MADISTKWIEAQIITIMIQDGPDGHIDGSDLIASFVKALLLGKQEDWLKNYDLYSKSKKKDRQKYEDRLNGYV